jgi:hypothetical protein
MNNQIKAGKRSFKTKTSFFEYIARTYQVPVTTVVSWYYRGLTPKKILARARDPRRLVRRSALAMLVLAAAPSPEQPLSPWHYGTDCYVPAPDVFAMQRARGNFDAYLAYGGAANDLACFRLNQTLMHLRRGQ